MWAHRTHQWGGDLRWEEVTDPTPNTGEVLLRVEACGVGRTVLNALAGDLSDERSALPRVPGHEIVGRVLAAGPAADENLIDRLVVAYFYLFCGVCPECLAGREQRCLALEGWIGVHRDGGYAPLATLPSRNAIPVPDGMDPVTATVVPDAVATSVHVAHRSRIGDADVVVVIGAGGGVGTHMIQVARLWGAEVIGLDVGDDKLGLVGDLGALPISSPSFEGLTERLGGHRPSVVVDLVGSADSIAWGRGILVSGGRQVLMTTFPGQETRLSAREMVFSESEVLGSRYATRAEVKLAADLVGRGEVRPVIGAIVEPKEVLTLHQGIRRNTLGGRGAIDWRMWSG